MEKCYKCGAEIRGAVKFCPYCGAELKAGNTYSQSGYNQGGNDYNSGYTPNSTYTSEFDPRDIEDNRVISILCYFGLLLLIPLLARPYSQYVKYHANQGIVLLILLIASEAIMIIPILGWIAGLVGNIFCLICLILGIINTLNGQAKPLPIIGQYQILR
jgi:Predicted membrane protein